MRTAVIVFAVFVVVSFFRCSSFIHLLGCDDIRTMKNGTYCYYCIAKDERGNEYTLPAKVKIVSDLEQSDTETNFHRSYAVQNVYFKNGGYLYFEDSGTSSYPIKDYCIDQNGKGWDLKLTNRRTSHEKVTETPDVSVKDILIALAEMAIFADNIALVFKSKKEWLHKLEEARAERQKAEGEKSPLDNIMF